MIKVHTEMSSRLSNIGIDNFFNSVTDRELNDCVSNEYFTFQIYLLQIFIINFFLIYCSNWAGIPDNLETAMQYSDGRTYFFKHGNYYKFDDATLKVEEARPAYPRDTGEFWFGCPTRNSPLLFPK